MGKPSLSKILAGYQKTMDQLQQLVKANEVAVGNKQSTISQLEGEITSLTNETAKANKIKENISTILDIQ